AGGGQAAADQPKREPPPLEARRWKPAAGSRPLEALGAAVYAPPPTTGRTSEARRLLRARRGVSGFVETRTRNAAGDAQAADVSHRVRLRQGRAGRPHRFHEVPVRQRCPGHAAEPSAGAVV